MSPAGRRRPLGLTIAGLSALVGVVASGFGPSVLFDLTGSGRERWTQRFSSGQAEAVIQVDRGEGLVPSILPGPLDDWAGGTRHRLTLRFAAPARESALLLKVAETEGENPTGLTVSVNGRDSAQIHVADGIDSPRRYRRYGYTSSYEVGIPASSLNDRAEQTLTIENHSGGWVSFSGLQLRQRPPVFSLSHYLSPGPPPRRALVALGVALLAIWTAVPRDTRATRSSILILGAGLVLLVVLGIAPWPPTGPARSFLEWKLVLSAPRAIWLLLALGVLASLAPGLPRVSVPRLLEATAFASGAIVMVLEMVGFRLLSPFFGYSVYVWGALLGVVMGALAVGYYVGGRLADRWPSMRVLYQALLATALLILTALYAYPAIIRLAVRLPLVWGSLLAALLLCFVPMMGLSLTPPFVIRALAAARGVGVTAGRVYAFGTCGSIVGTVASAFVLMTGLGPHASWGLAGLTLFLVSVYGLAHLGDRRASSVALVLGVLLVLIRPLAPDISVAALRGALRIYATESEYSHLEIIELGTTLQLVPQRSFTHAIYDEETIFEPSIADGLLPALLVRPATALLLGLGAGTLARLYLHAYPGIRIDGVEIDRETIRLGQRFLGLREDPRLRTFVDDARVFLARHPTAHYDLILVDLWQGGVFVPYYTVTREFFALGRERLTAGGILAIVIGRPRPLDSPHRRERYGRLLKAVGNTVATAFPSVFHYPARDVAHYFVATEEPTSLQAVRARLASTAIPGAEEYVHAGLRRLTEYRPDPSVAILTDDLAPVDQLIYDAFFRQ